jgi:threonyl-tRNA synthetase
MYDHGPTKIYQKRYADLVLYTDTNKWRTSDLRVRGFTQDDAYFVHQATRRRVQKVIDLVLCIWLLGFENFTAQISLRDKENRDSR